MHFLRNGFILSQLDGEGMRAMEEQQQQRHIKEVYMYIYGFCLKVISKRPWQRKYFEFFTQKCLHTRCPNSENQ